MKNQYRLINPIIKGNMTTTFTAKNNLDAANQFWMEFSQYITQDVPKFAFSMEHTGSNTVHHFVVKERENHNSAKYDIQELDLKLSSSNQKLFRDRVHEYGRKAVGGKHHHHHHHKSSKDKSSDE